VCIVYVYVCVYIYQCVRGSVVYVHVNVCMHKCVYSYADRYVWVSVRVQVFL